MWAGAQRLPGVRRVPGQGGHRIHIPQPGLSDEDLPESSGVGRTSGERENEMIMWVLLRLRLK